MEMRYAEAVAAHKIEIARGAVPEPGDSEILVKVTLCGIDWPTFRHVIEGGDTVYPANGSNNLGLAHEGSGQIVSVGRDVTTFRAGDRVTYLGPGFQEYAVIKPEHCGKLPDGVDYLDLLGEPLAVMYHTAVKVRRDCDQTVAVFGAGYMGLGIIHLLSRMGCKRIIAVEKDANRLRAAGDMGANVLINPGEQEMPKAISDATDRTGVDVAIEATGSEQVLGVIDEAVRPGGTIIVHGWFSGEKRVHLDKWHVNDLTVAFSHPAPHDIYGRQIEAVGRMVADKQIDPRRMITHEIPFSDVVDLEGIIRGSENYIKGVVIL